MINIRIRVERTVPVQQVYWCALEDAVDRVLTASSAPLDTFRLRVAHDDYVAAHRWIRRGLERRPAAFHLRCDDAFDLRCDDASDSDDEDDSPCFPDLTMYPGAGAYMGRFKTLHLTGLHLSADFAETLVAKEFTALEELQLEECRYHFSRIASSSLTKLSMDRCSHDYFKLHLATPRLTSLRIRGKSPTVTADGEMPSLVTASLRHPAGELGILRSLRDATTLNLVKFSTTAFLDDDGDFPVFRNLRTLHLDECDVGVECQVLRRFILNAPRLERLALRYCEILGGSRSNKRKYGSEETSSSDRRGPTAYECTNLKSVELRFYEDQDVSELDDALGDISREAVLPIESSLRNGKQKVIISYK
ncbi:hypothetical protein EJB05_37888, partial [Eragrostis curvula]